MLRSIEKVFQGAPFHMVGNGFRVSNYFPAATDFEKRMSPFFLLDYHPPLKYPATRDERRGVGPHPHRGFETVTVAYQGAVAHHDSAGHAGVIRPGEAQWMTAGSGILHNEYHEKAFARAGGVMQMAQIWVNLPRRLKMTAPKYQALDRAAIPETPLAGEAGTARVIAGSYGETKGPAASFTPANMIDLRLLGGGRARLSTPKEYNTFVLVLDGRARVNGSGAAGPSDAVLFKHDGEAVELEALADSTVLFLSGEPIEEPLVHYGPFVMCSVDEINQAVADYNAGKFGQLEA